MDAACIVLDVDGVTAIAHAHADTFGRVDEELNRLLRTVHALSCTPDAHYAGDNTIERLHAICDRLSDSCKK